MDTDFKMKPGNPSEWHEVQVEGCRIVSYYNGTADVVVDNDNPEFWSVYLRDRDGAAMVYGDFATPEAATAYAEELHHLYGYPIAPGSTGKFWR